MTTQPFCSVIVPARDASAMLPRTLGALRDSDLPPEQRSLIMQAKAEVDRIREMLDGVLRDLEDVCEQLTRAEHEKDVAEAEIEQLRDSLRRLQR